MVNPTCYQAPVVRQNPVVIGQPAVVLQLIATFHMKLCAIITWDKVLVPTFYNTFWRKRWNVQPSNFALYYLSPLHPVQDSQLFLKVYLLVYNYK
jgi:hypothetical protein